jgi:hypothetical protein
MAQKYIKSTGNPINGLQTDRGFRQFKNITLTRLRLPFLSTTFSPRRMNCFESAVLRIEAVRPVTMAQSKKQSKPIFLNACSS